MPLRTSVGTVWDASRNQRQVPSDATGVARQVSRRGRRGRPTGRMLECEVQLNDCVARLRLIRPKLAFQML